MNRLIAASLGLLALPGCTTPRPVTVECAEFRSSAYLRPVTRSPVLQAIQSDAAAGQPPAAPGNAQFTDALFTDDQIDAAIEQQVMPLLADLAAKRALKLDAARAALLPTGPDGRPVVLLLSGGGQWGAFGASYLHALEQKSPQGLPRFNWITGVSTGALQALFIGANQVPEARGAKLMEQLVRNYSPAHESEIVKRSGFAAALFKGSVARLGPLRRKIEHALCPTGGGASFDCPMIRHLASDAAPLVFLGIVEASSGNMQAVNITQIARDAVAQGGSAAQLKNAQQCITGAALASVAMPFYYQQVQVRSKEPGKPTLTDVTYYDGGVRQSVFFGETVQMVQKLQNAGAFMPAAAGRNDDGPRIYAVRNGPTVATPEPGIDEPTGAVKSALRGYSLLVNQTEIASLEMIRRHYPRSEMFVATADGYNRDFIDPDQPGSNTPACRKRDKNAMFEPQFMTCLRAFGRNKAAKPADDTRPDGWIAIP